MNISTRALRTRVAAVAATSVLLIGAAAAAPALASTSLGTSHSTPSHSAPKPTVVLVHGAWADSSSWSAVTARLQHDGYNVLVPPVSLTDLNADAGALAAYLAQRTTGPVVLVGHSYGGAVVTDAGASDPDVKALVYVDAFIPDQGQSLGSLLAGTGSPFDTTSVDPTTVFDFTGLPGGDPTDPQVYLKPTAFFGDFAQDLPHQQAAVLEAGQLPISAAALGEAATAPAWKTVPSWAVVGTQDKVIPPAAQLAMATHAGARIATVRASHVSLVSQPAAVANVIEKAAASVH